MPNIASTIVEVCVFRTNTNRHEYLLLQRAENDRIYPGIWQIVSGSIKPGETATQAALRELREETKLRAKRFWVVPLVNSFYVSSEDVLHFTTVFAAEANVGEELRLSSEHQNSSWLSNDEAMKKLVWPGQRKAISMVQEFIIQSPTSSNLTEISLSERNSP